MHNLIDIRVQYAPGHTLRQNSAIVLTDLVIDGRVARKESIDARNHWNPQRRKIIYIIAKNVEDSADMLDIFGRRHARHNAIANTRASVDFMYAVAEGSAQGFVF